MELSYGFCMILLALVFAMVVVSLADRTKGKLQRDRHKLDLLKMGLKGAHRKTSYNEKLLEKLDSFDIVFPKDISNKSRYEKQQYETSKKSYQPSNLTTSYGNVKRNSSHKRHYTIQAFGETMHIYLVPNQELVSHSTSVEYWKESSKEQTISRSEGLACHFHGKVLGDLLSNVALGVCNGLQGYIMTSKQQYFIEPLWNSTNRNLPTHEIPHVIYTTRSNRNFSTGQCPLQENTLLPEWLMDSDIRSSINETRQFHHKAKRRKRSISTDRYVETLVVADQEMVDYHGRDNLESYIMSVMNIVAKLYRDASIGNSINIVVNRIIILQEAQEGLRISHNADRTLKSFCAWQQLINPAADNDHYHDIGIIHHDNAVLLTRYDICSHKNEPCGTLGLAPVAGMCEPDRSCSIVQDIGLATAFTIAHEMGHNFGMQHDGAGNHCGAPGSGTEAKLMARHLTESSDPFTWSECSQQYVTAFLDSGRGSCLDNRPPEEVRPYPDQLAGTDVDGDQQCKWQYDSTFILCEPEKMCSELHCMNRRGECLTNSLPAADGTPCVTTANREGWCFEGSCLNEGQAIDPMDGHWGQWSSWRECSRTCGGGVASSERQCDNPRPRNGGKFCTGERKRYRSCNIEDCPSIDLDFRAIQCSQFDNVQFRGRFYSWRPFIGGPQSKPCSLSCLAEGYNFYTERAPKVIDGTRCYPDLLDVCINGECRHVGCDRILGSEAREDVCRVCNGDGSSCAAIRGEVNDRFRNLSDTYKDIIRIPKGAVNIMVKEKVISRNYLVLQTAEDGEFHLNGAWTIDWPRKVQAAKTVFQYDRPKRQTENLYALGPISQEIIIHLLLQEDNLGIEYEYHMPKRRHQSRNADVIEYAWQYMAWSPCSQSCATGTKVALSICMRLSDKRTVDESNCSGSKPESKRQECNQQSCPARWKIGDWSSCSKSCDGGIKTRDVSCVHQTSFGEEYIDAGACPGRRPKQRTRCRKEKCPTHWAVDRWSECQTTCGDSFRTRAVTCVTPDGNVQEETECSLIPKPETVTQCFERPCPTSSWVVGPWQECNVKCGRGRQMREVACATSVGQPSNLCPHSERPIGVRECNGPCLPQPDTECKDIEKVNYCPLVLQFNFCDRPYFHHMCCETCSAAGFNLQRRRI